MSEDPSRETSSIRHQGEWLNFCEREITDAHGNPKIWEYVTRRNTIGAACIVATTCGDDPRLILVKQFRPSVDSPVIEFPAGLIDAGESAADTALRELEEETGYTGKVLDVGPVVYSSPGLTDESVTWVTVEITGRKEQRLTADEAIEVIELPLKNLRNELQKLADTGAARRSHESRSRGTRAKAGALIDAKLWFYARGLENH